MCLIGGGPTPRTLIDQENKDRVPSFWMARWLSMETSIPSTRQLKIAAQVLWIGEKLPLWENQLCCHLGSVHICSVGVSVTLAVLFLLST